MRNVRCITTAAAWLALAAVAPAAATPLSYPQELASARIAMAAGQYRQARQDYARAAKLPGADRALCAIGMAEADGQRNAFGDSEKEASRGIRLAATPGERAAALELAGAIEVRQAAFAQIQAEAEADAAHRLADFSAGHQRQWLARGESDLQAALALAPRNAELRFDLAVCLLREGQTAAAQAQWRAYLQQDPRGAAASLARLYLHDPDAALAERTPGFQIVTDGGVALSPRALEGKVVLLDFWGSWCPPCRASVGSLQQIWKEFGRGGDFVLLSVDSGEPAAAGNKFIARHRMVWPQYWDGRKVMAKAFRVHAFPTFILLDRRGVIRARWSGESGWRTQSLLGNAVKATLRWRPQPGA